MGFADPSGYGTHMREVARALAEAGHEVVRYVVGSGGLVADAAAGADAAGAPRAPHRLAAHLPPRIRHLARDLGELLADRRAAGPLARLVASAESEAIYERSAFMQLAGLELAAARGLPHILEVNAPIEERRDHHGYPLFRIGRAREERKLALADQVVCVTSALRDYLAAAGADPARIHVIPNAVRPAAFVLAPAARAALRARLGIGHDQVAVGFVGRFGFWRGMHSLLGAAAAPGAATPRPHFVLVGDGQLMPDVRRFVAEHRLESRVTLTGGLSPAAVPAHVAALDIGILAGSPWYSSPIKLFEYGAAGLAIVAPQVPAVAEVLADGSEGILVPPEDAAALAAAVVALVDDEARRRALGQRYRARVAAEFTWARVAARITALCESSPRRRG
jgi:glycosyltransferase involved in cell wall biosynthesis